MKTIIESFGELLAAEQVKYAKEPVDNGAPQDKPDVADYAAVKAILVERFKEEKERGENLWVGELKKDVLKHLPSLTVLHRDTDPKTKCVVTVDKDTELPYAFQNYSFHTFEAGKDGRRNKIGHEYMRLSLHVGMQTIPVRLE